MRRLLVILSCLCLLATALTPAAAQDPPVDPAPPMEGEAVSLLPPGNSGFVSVDGQAAGTVGGSYGDNLDDQTDLYWGLEGYAGQGFLDPADAVRSETLLDGAVRIHWDAFGVPAIHGDTGYDVWYGAGYAIAQIRLFLMDAVRRLGRGTYAELVGAYGVSDDVMTRTLGYSEEEYLAMFDGLSADAQDAFGGYAAGANAWIEEVLADPSLLPVEYALLSTTPEPLDLIDVMAAGVLITRTVASEGGQEMENVALLRDLEAELGEEAGRGVFTDLVWQQDDDAVVTVPREEGTFPNAPFATDPDALDAAFQTAADYAATLPLELAEGQGTGAYPDPASLDVPVGAAAAAPAASSEAETRGSGGVPAGPPSALTVGQTPTEALIAFGQQLHGGSIAVAVGPSQTADGNALLLSGPQLGYSYPSLLVELEVHGGGYDARGASVPALPTVGIGYTDRVAWALTTGYSKTIDSFIETVRGSGMDLEYRHDGEWKAADCRTETIPFREAAAGALPVGPPLRSEDVVVCRTVHGPIVAEEAGDGERLARSVQYQMFGEEADTVEGVLAWNRAKDLEDFEAAMRQVTWNENTTYADADGHIAFWHPGIHRERPDWDLRLPMPGDGSADFGEILPFEDLPHSVDPAQGFLANWNNKPAHDWLDGIGVGSTSRPGGAVQRVSNALELLRRIDDHTFATLQDLEVEAGLRDPRATPFLPIILDAIADEPDLAPVRDLLAAWNRRHYDPPGSSTTFTESLGTSSVEDGTDGPAATAFEAVLEALLADVFADEWPGREADDLFTRQLGVGSHRYDMSPAHNLLLRVLRPSSSALATSRDYLDGRDVDAVVVGAVEDALADLTATHGADPSTWRRTTHTSEVSSLTGVTGPSSTQPYMDRGSYIHVVGFDAPVPLLVTRAGGATRIETAVAASQAGFPSGSDVAVLADAGGYHDALLANPLAGALDAPLLLVDGSLGSGALAPVTRAELDRLDVREVVVVGSGVPEAVLEDLRGAALPVRRVGTGDPYAVGEAVAAELGRLRAAGSARLAPVPGEVPDAYVVSGENFPDAVSIAGVAARTGTPILMVTRDAIPEATARVLEGAESVVVIGGTAVVSDGVLAALPSAERVWGAERYATAEQVLRHAREVGLYGDHLLLATGENFPDSLVGGALADAVGGVVALVRGRAPELPGAAFAYARAQRASTSQVTALGGTAVIGDDLLALLS